MSFKIANLPVSKDQSTNQFGVEEIKDVIRFAAAFGNAYGEAAEDGFDWLDILDFINPLTKLPDAVTGIEHVKEEMLDLDQTEAQELIDMVVTEFNIPQDSAEEYVEDAVELALKVWMFILKHHLPESEE